MGLYQNDFNCEKMEAVLDPETRFINHKMSPPDEIVRWLAIPQSESSLKQERGIGRLIAMDWGNYPVSTSPSEVQTKKDKIESNTESNTSGEKAEKTLNKLIEYGPSAEFPSVFAAKYQEADSLRSGAVVGSVGPLPNEEWQADYSDKILLVIGKDGTNEDSDETSGKVLDVVPVPPNRKQEEPTGDGIVDIVREKANDEATRVVDEIINEGSHQEANPDSEDGVNDLGYYILQAVGMNEDANWIRYRDYPLFASIQHRGTTNGWNKGSDHLRAAYSISLDKELSGLDDFHARIENDGEIVHRSGIGWSKLRASDDRSEINGPVALLSDGQLETLSNEFLRGGAPADENNQEPYYHQVHNTYPVGGSLADVDILAAGTDRANKTQVEIAAQVSFETDSYQDKMDRLVAWMDGITEEGASQDVWYFGPKCISGSINEGKLEECGFIPIERLPKLFEESDELDEAVVEDIFSIPPTEKVSMPGSQK